MLSAKRLHKSATAEMAHLDELLDEALKETFPASDSIAITVELELSEDRQAEDRDARLRKESSAVE